VDSRYQSHQVVLTHDLEDHIDQNDTRHAQAIYPTIQLSKIFSSVHDRKKKIIKKKKDKIKKLHEDINESHDKIKRSNENIMKSHENIFKIKESIVTEKNSLEELRCKAVQIFMKTIKEVTSEHSNYCGGI